MPAHYLHQIFLLARRLLLCYGLYFICRLIFYLANLSFFPGSQQLFFNDAFFGLRFDSFSIVATNALFIVLSVLPIRIFFSSGYQKLLLVLFVITNSLALALNLIDVAYFPFTRKRSTADLFSQLGGQTDIASLLPSFLADFWWVMLLFPVMIYLIIKFYPRLRSFSPEQDIVPRGNPVAIVLAMVGVFFFSFLALRGGLGPQPLDIVNAGASGRAAVLLNTPFSIIKSMDQQTLPEYDFFSEQELKSLYNPVHQFEDIELKRSNVLVLILESFSKEYTALGGKKSYTPFLDSLMGHSLVYTNAFSNSTKSIEGIPAILSSLPSFMDVPFINSVYANNHQTSIASLLAPAGYQTGFFHGGSDGTMNFTEWAAQAGYERYYGRDEYNNDTDYDGAWGIYDEPFLQFSADQLATFREPFHAALFTLSSHHPYAIPSAYKQRFSKETEVGAGLLYADHALRQFFRSAKEKPWFANTLFVLVADHATILKALFISNPSGNLSIPVVFYKPDNSLKGMDSQVFGQTDILPEVMRQIGYNKKFFSFGKDPAQKSDHIVCHYTDGSHQLFTDSMFYVFHGPELGKVYNYLRDTSLSTNIAGKHPGLDSLVTRKFRAMLQVYNGTLNSDKGYITE